MPTRITAHLALFAVALIYAINYLVAKAVMNDEYVGPLGFVLIRVFFATLLFWLVTLSLGVKRIERKDIPRFILCGMTGVAANQMLFFSGLELTTPVHASLIMTTSPIIVLVFSYFLLKERITARRTLGILLGCAGAVVLVSVGREVAANPEYTTGDIMVFLNAASYALYLVLVKRLLEKYPPLTVIKWVFTFGLLFVLPIGLSQFRAVAWETFQTSTWLSVGYVILFTTFLAYLLNVIAMRRVRPSTVGFYIYLQPLLASMLSVFLGVEELSASKILSGVLIFIGVYLVSDISLRRADARKKSS